MTKKSYLNRVRKLEIVPSFAKKAAANVEYQKRVASLKKRGAIPLAEIGKNFEKISWDLYKKNPPEPDAGSIWQVTKIKNANGEEESWLVVYTDDNDKIVRQVKASMEKEAQTSFYENKLEAAWNDLGELENLLGDIQTDYDAENLKVRRQRGDERYARDLLNDLESVKERIRELEGKTASTKTAHTPGAIVQVVVPQGHINEKYNGKVGEVTAAFPDRSKISFKDLPPLWFEDNTIREVVPCPMCQSNISLQKLKKVGKIKCRCSAFYTWRQLEKIAKTATINEKASRKVKKTAGSNDWVIEEEKLPNGYTVMYYAWVDDNDAGGDIIVLDSATEEEVEVPFDLPGSSGEGMFEDLDWEDIVDTDMLDREYLKVIEKVKELTPPPGFQYEMKVSKKARIVEKGNEYCVVAESGRSMGCYPTKEEAEGRLKQVEMFKHMKGSKKTAQELSPDELENLLKGKRFRIVGLDEFGLGDWEMSESEYEELLRHNNQEAVVTGISISGTDIEEMYIDIRFDDGYEVEALSTYHLEGIGSLSSKKTAQNVIFWFDDPKALKNLRYLQGPPTGPAGEEPLERPEGLEGKEKPELEAEKEVEKEASVKTAQDMGYEVGEFVEINSPGHSRHEDRGEVVHVNPDVDLFLIEFMDGVKLKFSGANIRKISSKKTAEAKKKTKEKINGIVKESLEKEAQGGSSFEALRGGGGGSADQLEPMGWQVQETKTPELPEQVPELREEEEVEEIVIRISPEDKAVKIDFEGEKEEEVEKPVGAEAPPEKPIVKPGEELEEGEGLEEIPVNF